MSWGIDFTADIFLSKQDYGENVHRVQDEIDDLKKKRQLLKEKMLMLAVGGKNLVSATDCEGYECDAVDALHTTFSDILELYDQYNSQIYDLYLYKEYLENKKDNGET